MNVFILCTGRCGSLTFIRACTHMTNFTAGHETRCHKLGDDRLAYRSSHIEADCRLPWFLGRLDEKYGNDAFYVHLTRDAGAVARSWAKKFGTLGGMAPAYRDAILVDAARPGFTRLESSADYVRTINENIRHFLKDKTNVLHFSLENAEADFAIFWRRVGAEGPYEKAVAEWRVRHDTNAILARPRQRLRALVRRTLRAAMPPR